jgi:TPR repeat protein
MDYNASPMPGLDVLLKEYSKEFRSIEKEAEWLISINTSGLPSYFLTGNQSSIVSCHNNLPAYLHPIAERRNDPIAQFILGLCYQHGVNVPKDQQQSFCLFLIAAEQGLPEAQFRIACINEASDKVKQAVDCSQKAADKGHSEAHVYLGNMFKFGRGVPLDHEKAVFYYRKSADQGNPKGQLALAFMYANGQGVMQDLEQAFELNRLAAKKGNVDAMCNVGIMYLHGMVLRRALIQDLPVALVQGIC